METQNDAASGPRQTYDVLYRGGEIGCARREFVLVIGRLLVVHLIPDFGIDAVRSA